MKSLIPILVSGILGILTGCGLPPPPSDEDQEFAVDLVITNRLDLLVQVGDGLANLWTDVPPGQTVTYATKVRAGVKTGSVSMRIPELKAFEGSRVWGDTVKFRGNVSGIRELAMESDGESGAEFMTREGRIYYFAPEADTAVFMARHEAPREGTSPTEAYTEDGVNWWRMRGPTGLINQGYEFGRKDSTREIACERVGCFDL